MCVVLTCGARFTTQSIAWANMLVTAIPTQGLSTGLQQTFDGEHPCALCKQIQESDNNKDLKNTIEERRVEFIACLEDRADQKPNTTLVKMCWVAFS